MEDLQTIKLDIELVRASHVIDVLKILHIFVNIITCETSNTALEFDAIVTS